jgi:hypothetical protein
MTNKNILNFKILPPFAVWRMEGKARVREHPDKLLRLFDDFDNSPILVFGKLSGFCDSYGITYTAFVVLIVSLEFGGSRNRLFIEGMLALFGNGYNYRLIHFVRNNNADSFFS